MRSLFIILGFIATVLALVLAVTPLSQMAYLPAIAALIFGGIAFYISNQKRSPDKSVHLIFLLTTISLVLTTYKVIFNTNDNDSLQELQLKEETSTEDSKQILDESDLGENDIDYRDMIETPELPELEGLEGLKD